MSDWLVYNKGKSRIYLTAEKSSFLWQEYLKGKPQNLDTSRFVSPTLRDMKQEQEKWDSYERTLLSMGEEARREFSSFSLVDDAAQSEIYELVYAFCIFHKSCYMACKRPNGYYIPEMVDVFLPVTFGKQFYFVVDRRKVFPFLGQRAVSYLIDVPSISKLEGDIDGFTITYCDRKTLTITQESKNSNGASVFMG